MFQDQPTSFAQDRAAYMCIEESQVIATTNVAALEQLSFNLSSDPASRQFNCTLRWIIYKIVEANRGITYVQLKKVLRGEYGIDRHTIDTAISSLTSPSLLKIINKWRNPRAADVGSDVGIHLSIASQKSPTFAAWELGVLEEFPELASFSPPTINKKVDGR